MKPYFEILMNNWEILSPIVYEILARLWPTRWNISILDNAIKIINWIVPNLRKKKGNEMMANEKQNLVPVNLNKHIIKSLLILFLFAPLIQANAQIWQNFKGVRLVNQLDSTQVLSVDGSIYYNEQSNKFRAMQDGQWYDLIVGGGSGGAFWPLAGSAALTDNVTIFGGNKELTLGSITPFAVFTTVSDETQILNSAGDLGMFITNSGDQVGFAAANNAITFDKSTGDVSLDLIDGDLKVNNTDLQYLSASNQILMTNVATTSTSSIFGGEIQLDDIVNSYNLQLNNFALTSSGATDFAVQCDQSLIINAEQNVEINSRESGTVSIGDNVVNGDSVRVMGRINVVPFDPISSDLFSGVTTASVSGVTNVSSETDCDNCHYTRLISQITVSGQFTVTPSAGNVQTTLSMLPPLMEGDFSDTFDATGTFTAFESTTGTFVPGTVWAVSGGNAVVFNFKPTTTNDYTIYFQFQYVWQN